ncbi:MAG: hypothetical protein AB1330_13065 [Bacillota bacterium]
MTVYKCLTHGVELILSPGKREIKIPLKKAESTCCLPKMKEPREGEQGACRIVKVGEG